MIQRVVISAVIRNCRELTGEVLGGEYQGRLPGKVISKPRNVRSSLMRGIGKWSGIAEG